jgi:hypothetical protein
MNLELRPDLEQRLQRVAEQRSQSVPELVEGLLTQFLDSLPDDASVTVRATQSLLSRVWPVEDFSDWQPPDGR